MRLFPHIEGQALPGRGFHCGRRSGAGRHPVVVVITGVAARDRRARDVIAPAPLTTSSSHRRVAPKGSRVDPFQPALYVPRMMIREAGIPTNACRSTPGRSSLCTAKRASRSSRHATVRALPEAGRENTAPSEAGAMVFSQVVPTTKRRKISRCMVFFAWTPWSCRDACKTSPPSLSTAGARE